MNDILNREQRRYIDLIERATGKQFKAPQKTLAQIAGLFITTPHELRGNLDALRARCDLIEELADTMNRAEIERLGAIVKKPDLTGSGFGRKYA